MKNKSSPWNNASNVPGSGSRPPLEPYWRLAEMEENSNKRKYNVINKNGETKHTTPIIQVEEVNTFIIHWKKISRSR